MSLASELVRESSSEKDSFLIMMVCVCDLFDKNNCLERGGAKRSVRPVKTWNKSASFAEVRWS